jgi:hypothetical protein
VASPINAKARPAPVQEGSLAPAAEVPAILANTVSVRGPNGQHKPSFGATHAYPRGPGDTGTNVDDGPDS